MNKKYKEYSVEPPLVTKHDLENVDFASGNSVKKKLVDSMIGNIPIVVIESDENDVENRIIPKNAL